MEDKIIKLRKEGKTYDDIRNELNCTYDIIKQICRKHGLNYSGNNIRFNETDKSEVIEYFREVKNIRKTASKFKITRENIREHFITDDIFYEVLPRYKKGYKKKSNSKSVVEWRIRLKEMLIKSKGGGCQLCGYNKHNSGLDFHHVNEEEKEFGISGKVLSKERAINEVKKCVLVCRNCHSEIHGGLHPDVDFNKLKNEIDLTVFEETKVDLSKCECGEKKDVSAIQCNKCRKLKNLVIKTEEEYNIVKNKVNEIGYTATGRLYGVADNTIKKRLKTYEQYKKEGLI